VSGKRPTRHGLSLVLSAAAISGVATFVNTFAVAGTNSDAFITVRNGLVALLLVPLFLWSWSSRTRDLRPLDWARLVVIGLVGGAIPFLLFFRGLQLAGSEGRLTASFLFRTLFLMAAVLAIVFLRERPSRRLWAAAVALLGGNVVLIFAQPSGGGILFQSPVWNGGAVLVLAATALWAAEYTISKHAMRDLAPMTVALGRMGFGAVFLAAFLVATGQAAAAASFDVGQVLGLALSALILLGFVTTWYSGLKHVDLSLAAAVLVLAFPVTWVLGAVAGRASFGIAEAAGASLVAFGLVLAIGVGALRDSFALGFRILLRRGATR
jgi:drug/metabolite transporter (DMT)-like permease